MKLRIDDDVDTVKAVDSHELWEKIGVKQQYKQWVKEKVVDNVNLVNGKDYFRGTKYITGREDGPTEYYYLLTLPLAFRISHGYTSDAAKEVRRQILNGMGAKDLGIVMSEVVSIPSKPALPKFTPYMGKIGGRICTLVDAEEVWASLGKPMRDFVSWVYPSIIHKPTFKKGKHYLKCKTNPWILLTLPTVHRVRENMVSVANQPALPKFNRYEGNIEGKLHTLVDAEEVWVFLGEPGEDFVSWAYASIVRKLGFDEGKHYLDSKMKPLEGRPRFLLTLPAVRMICENEPPKVDEGLDSEPVEITPIASQYTFTHKVALRKMWVGEKKEYTIDGRDLWVALQGDALGKYKDWEGTYITGPEQYREGVDYTPTYAGASTSAQDLGLPPAVTRNVTVGVAYDLCTKFGYSCDFTEEGPRGFLSICKKKPTTVRMNKEKEIKGMPVISVREHEVKDTMVKTVAAAELWEKLGNPYAFGEWLDRALRCSATKLEGVHYFECRSVHAVPGEKTRFGQYVLVDLPTAWFIAKEFGCCTGRAVSSYLYTVMQEACIHPFIPIVLQEVMGFHVGYAPKAKLTEPVAKPTEPVTKPTEPVAKPTEPVTKPHEDTPMGTEKGRIPIFTNVTNGNSHLVVRAFDLWGQIGEVWPYKTWLGYTRILSDKQALNRDYFKVGDQVELKDPLNWEFSDMLFSVDKAIAICKEGGTGPVKKTLECLELGKVLREPAGDYTEGLALTEQEGRAILALYPAMTKYTSGGERVVLRGFRDRIQNWLTEE